MFRLHHSQLHRLHILAKPLHCQAEESDVSASLLTLFTPTCSRHTCLNVFEFQTADCAMTTAPILEVSSSFTEGKLCCLVTKIIHDATQYFTGLMVYQVDDSSKPIRFFCPSYLVQTKSSRWMAMLIKLKSSSHRIWESELQTGSNTATLTTSFGQFRTNGNGLGEWAHSEQRNGEWAAIGAAATSPMLIQTNRRQWLCKRVIFKMLTRVSKVD